MKSRSPVAVALRGVLAGGLAAFLFSGDGRILIELWLGIAVGVVLIDQMFRLVGHQRIIGRAGQWRPRFRSAKVSAPLAHGSQRSTEQLIDASMSDAAAFDRGLRPRLIAIADHQRRLGTNPSLGDVAWLVDPTVSDRTPTVDELNIVLDRLNVDRPAKAAP